MNLQRALKLDTGFRVRIIRRFLRRKSSGGIQMPNIMGFTFIFDNPRRNALRISIMSLVVMKDDRVHYFTNGRCLINSASRFVSGPIPNAVTIGCPWKYGGIT